ncbi:MAG: hypothetical protein F6J89_15220 [Symploca sp. SIO1C4]|uniref:Uncharacterized protein n=1 Tax=Symploca sp. SIO1C4 TaxID=2607765 RepID=A0A6B3NE94_9CYAN|nr:hypothetical protein [Symploca sp. SIO1C4]NET06685.1 hypothetical protein [Symploca sp. SIO2B6]NET49453.1 hypothetical protein [Merismopedia sp. SIO2A8]
MLKTKQLRASKIQIEVKEILQHKAPNKGTLHLHVDADGGDLNTDADGSDLSN